MDMIGMPIDMYAHHRRLSTFQHHHPNSLILPIPMHPSFGTSFSPLDPTKYLPSLHSSLFMPPSGSTIFNQHTENIFNRQYNSNNVMVTTLTTPPTTTSTTKPSIPLNHKIEFSGKEDEVTSSEEIQLTNFSQSTIYEPSSNNTTMVSYAEREALFESAAKLLFLAVKWAKSMPSFAQIPLKDQTTLLEESWSELFVITAAQYGLAIESKSKYLETLDKNLIYLILFLCFWSDILSTPPDQRTQKLQKAINHIITQRIDHTEAACLKALILFRPGIML